MVWQFLQQKISVVHEDEDLLAIDKPFDVRMDIPKPNGTRKWPTEYTCRMEETAELGGPLSHVIYGLL